MSAVIIGVIAGVLVVVAVFFIEQTLKVDDPVGAIAVHGVCGAFGVLSVGLFADGTYGAGLNGVPGTVRGLFYGDASQLAAQSIGVLTNIVFVFVSFYVFFKVVDAVIGNRVAADDEIEGLDIPEMGVLGYPDVVLSPAASRGTACLRSRRRQTALRPATDRSVTSPTVRPLCPGMPGQPSGGVSRSYHGRPNHL